MAEEVGAAYVSLIPSARNFSKRVKAELTKAMRPVKDDPVTVPVKPELDPVTSSLRSELDRQMRSLAKRIAIELPVGADTDGLRAKLQSQLDGIRSTLAMQVPTEPGDNERYRASLRSLLDSVRATERQTVDVDIAKDVDERTRGLLDRVGNAGTGLATALLGRFGTALMNPLIGIPALVAAAFAAPLLAAATAGAVLAGGGLAGILLGAFALRADEEVKAAGKGLLDSINQTLTEAAQPLKGPLIEAIGIIKKAFEDLGPELKNFFKEIAPSVPQLAQGFAGFLKQLSDTGAIDKFATAIGPVLGQLAMALPDLGNAVAQFLISMSEIGPEAAAAFGSLLRFSADIIRFLGDTIEFLVNLPGKVAAVGDAIGEFFELVGLGALTAILALGGFGPAIDVVKESIRDAGDFIADLWRKLTTKAGEAFGSVIGFARNLPGQIGSAVGNLGGLLIDAGRNVVQGLIDGIRSKLSALANIASQMAQTIRNYLPFSPAKVGPFSGSGAPFRSGQAIASDLAAGVESQLPTVTSAADELTAAFGRPGSGAMTAATTTVIRFDGFGLSDALSEWFRSAVRVEGLGAES